MTTKSTRELSLRDRLSRLGFLQACKLLGENGKALIYAGAKCAIVIDDHVSWTPEAFCLKVPIPNEGDAVVTISRASDAQQSLRWNCSACETACVHVGAAFSLLLEEKMALGLAVPPPDRVPVDSVGEETLVRLALQERATRARQEKMKVQSVDRTQPWTDYTATSTMSGKTYRIALRGEGRGVSYCSCPDFRTNTLGTCKHLLHVLEKVRRRFPASARRSPYRRKRLSVHLNYGGETTLRLMLPDRLAAPVEAIVGPLRDRPIEDLHDLVKRLRQLE